MRMCIMQLEFKTLKIADIICYCSSVNDTSAEFSVNEVKRLKIIVVAECYFNIIISSEMMKSITSDFNCLLYFFITALNVLMTF